MSHSGYIGLLGDAPASPKRSFFWYFENQDKNPYAPVILTVGGGPGNSAMLNALIGQSHCSVLPNGTTTPNSDAWTEHNNLVALDHPLNAGFSYGARVDNSHDAAFDVYDFLQKFYIIFPQLSRNPLILASGSYGGTYIPHIATVIQEQNKAISAGVGLPGAQHVNLESLMLSNPHTDALSHYTWTLQQRCKYTDLYNSSTCDVFYERIPFCLDAIKLVYEDPSITENRVRANTICQTTQLQKLEGRSYENVNRRCNGTLEDCIPEQVWVSRFLNNPATKERLGVPPYIHFSPNNPGVHQDFINSGDKVQPAHLMYPPLLKAGIRLLHYVGKLDAICPWPGVISSLKLLQSPYQSAFLAAPDVRWTGENATVRNVGEGAGTFTYILLEDSGHMVVKDQPALVKKIVDHWVTNKAFET